MGEAIEGLRRHGVPGIGVWRQFVDDYGTAQTAKHLKDAGLWVASYCTGAWFNRQGEAGLRAAIDENKAVFDQAAELGAPCVVMVVGGLVDGSRDLAGQRGRVRDGLAALRDHALDLGVSIALEPLHPMYAAERACLNTLKQANDLCDDLGTGCTTVVDVYHTWWDPELRCEIARGGGARVSTFHLCDWRVPTRNMRDRAMVGDGVADIGAIRSWLDAVGFDGPIELELFSELDWWQRDPEEVLPIAIERCAPFTRPRQGGSA
jgi:sugar phosphate isomerase/epimerase